ncbi:hypothetical protein [Trinickia dinghuensis]|nr:hypothetical protein [Trinickia dinghuensis]
MSSNRWMKRLSMAGIVAVVTACAPMGTSAPQADQGVVGKPAAAACQASDGSMVSDSTVVYKCAVPGQGVTGCARYTCQRCTNGTWGGEYTCRLP